jgi:aspartate racemase
LLGGLSWESTAQYYRIINEVTKRQLGKLHSAPIVLISLDFQEIEELQARGQWEVAGEFLSGKAKLLEASKADFVILCTNTMHKVADSIQQKIRIPLLHIADAAAEQILAQSLKQVGLLGTKFTMEEDFYRNRLESHGLKVSIPDECDRAIIHRVIYQELCLGKISDRSKSEFLRIISKMETEGIEGVVAGCTEIGMLVQQKDLNVEYFDTTEIHANAAVELALR